MQSRPPRNFQHKLIRSLIACVLILVIAPISLGFIFYVTNLYLEIQQNTQLVDSNFPKIKVGMTSAQVEAMLGWPDAVYNDAENKSNRLPRSQLSSWFRISYLYLDRRTDYQGIPINTKGREVWIYQYAKYPPLHAPAIVFDIETKKVVEITKVRYDE